MGIIIAYITGKMALRKKQNYVLPMCVLFVCYNCFANIIVSLPSFFTKNSMLFIHLEIIVLLLFLSSCIVASQKTIHTSKKVIPWCMAGFAILLRVIRVVYSRITINRLGDLSKNFEIALDFAQNGMEVSTLLLFGVQLMGYFILIFFLVNLRKTEYQ